jgi:AcrR family transcriptional regulator
VKQEERRAATRDAVLGAAWAMFGNDGYALTSVDDVAARAGVAKGAVYHHFPTKAALFEAVVEAVSARALGDVIQATLGATDFWSAIKTGNHAFFQTCADPATARILLHDGPAVLGWAKWRQIDQRNFGGLLRQAFATAIENGILISHDPEKMTRIVLGAVTEGVIDANESENFAESAAQYVKIISAMISGWAIKT